MAGKVRPGLETGFWEVVALSSSRPRVLLPCWAHTQLSDSACVPEPVAVQVSVLVSALSLS